MSKLKYNWNSSNIIDDVDYHEEDAAIFKKLFPAEEIKEESDTSAAPLSATHVLKGKIVEITKDFIIVDVGLKSEGLVPTEEFTDASELFLGNVVEVFLDQTEGENGQIVVSRDKARRLRQWENIAKNCVEGSIVSGKILRKVKGGLIVDIGGGVEAFLPGSQITNKRVKNLDDYPGEIYDFKIIKINTERKNIVISRRELLEEERMSKKVEMLENFQEGQLRHGVVKNITDFGVFLDIDGVDGLLHITDMSWKRIKHPSEMVQIGDELEVIVLHVDREKGRVALGMKQKEANPLDEFEKKYPIGSRVKGKVVSLAPYGAFLEIEPKNGTGFEGLVHVSDMSWTTVSDPSELVKKGDELEVVVLGIQKDEGHISLGMKQLEKDPWEESVKKYAVGSTVKAEIRNLTNYGAFAAVEEGVDGLIHLADLSWTKKISHPSEVLSKGDKIDAMVLSIDRENRRISLGVKQLTQNPWENIEQMVPIGSLVKGVVTNITAFGAFVELKNGLEGLIHVTELSDEPFGKVEEVVHKGQTVTAKVIKVDPEQKKLSLSLKEDNRDDIVIGEKKKRTRKPKEKSSEKAAT